MISKNYILIHFVIFALFNTSTQASISYKTLEPANNMYFVEMKSDLIHLLGICHSKTGQQSLSLQIKLITEASQWIRKYRIIIQTTKAEEIENFITGEISTRDLILYRSLYKIACTSKPLELKDVCLALTPYLDITSSEIESLQSFFFEFDAGENNINIAGPVHHYFDS